MGNRLVRSHHVFDVRVQQQRREMAHIFALCISGKDPYGKPHEIRIDLLKRVSIMSYEYNIKLVTYWYSYVLSYLQTKEITVVCSCTAGKEGSCKHSIASLVYLERCEL